MEKRRILIIAGSDSSGGAGLEADQKVIAAHGGYAMTATTALTAQNTQGVSGIHHVPQDFVVKQIDACIDDIGVDMVKIGMLASAPTVDEVAAALRRHGSPKCVVDPVMVSTSGAQLLSEAAVTNLREEILPLTTVLTPNIPEARMLLQNAKIPTPDIASLADIITMAKNLHTLGPQYILIKGGHLPLTASNQISLTNADKNSVIDVLYDGHQTILFETDYFHSTNTHGTGCSLASAIASNIILKEGDVAAAVEASCRYIVAGIKTAPDLGKGNGPINHFPVGPLVEESVRRKLWED